MATSVSEELINLKEELLRIKAIIITEERLIRILREELGTQENKYRNGFEKIQRQILQILREEKSNVLAGYARKKVIMPTNVPTKKKYANNKKKKIKMLELIYAQELEPIEDSDLSDQEQLYYLETDSDMTTDSDYDSTPDIE